MIRPVSLAAPALPRAPWRSSRVASSRVRTTATWCLPAGRPSGRPRSDQRVPVSVSAACLGGEGLVLPVDDPGGPTRLPAPGSASGTTSGCRTRAATWAAGARAVTRTRASNFVSHGAEPLGDLPRRGVARKPRMSKARATGARSLAWAEDQRRSADSARAHAAFVLIRGRALEARRGRELGAPFLAAHRHGVSGAARPTSGRAARAPL